MAQQTAQQKPEAQGASMPAQDTSIAEQPIKKKLKWWIWLIVILVLIAAGIGIYFWLFV